MAGVELKKTEAFRALEAWRAQFDPATYGAEAPIRFFRYALGIEPHPWQQEVLLAFGRGDRKISIAACHGPGKTFLAAGLVWFMLVCRYPQNTVITAPSKSQLEDVLWKEILLMRKKLPEVVRDMYTVTKTRVELNNDGENSFCSARTARSENPEALQGVHCQEGWVLLIADEASGVSDKIFASAGGSMAGNRCTTILLGNPTRASGYFWRSHEGRSRYEWTRFQIGWSDSPIVGEDFEREKALEYGRDSNEYRIRVLGKFPRSEGSAIIPAGWVHDAVSRDVVMEQMIPTLWGLDVAGGGKYATGKNALVKRNALGVRPDILHWPGEDPMQVAGRVKIEWDDTHTNERPRSIMVDSIGIGAGVCARLREMGLPAKAINVSETKGIDSRRYMNLKANLWWDAREWFGQRLFSLPKCDGSWRRSRRLRARASRRGVDRGSVRGP